MNYRRIATVTGWLWIITFVTSIPARFFFYAPVLDHEGSYVTGAGTAGEAVQGPAAGAPHSLRVGTRRRTGSVGGQGSRPRRRYASGWSWRSSSIRLQTTANRCRFAQRGL